MLVNRLPLIDTLPCRIYRTIAPAYLHFTTWILYIGTRKDKKVAMKRVQYFGYSKGCEQANVLWRTAVWQLIFTRVASLMAVQRDSMLNNAFSAPLALYKRLVLHSSFAWLCFDLGGSKIKTRDPLSKNGNGYTSLLWECPFNYYLYVATMWSRACECHVYYNRSGLLMCTTTCSHSYVFQCNFTWLAISENVLAACCLCAGLLASSLGHLPLWN